MLAGQKKCLIVWIPNKVKNKKRETSDKWNNLKSRVVPVVEVEVLISAYCLLAGIRLKKKKMLKCLFFCYGPSGDSLSEAQA